MLGCGGGEPLALFGDADGDDFVLLFVYGFEDAGGGEERDFVLAGAATKEDAYAEFFLHVWIQVSTNFPVFCARKKLEGEKQAFAGVF